MRHVESSDGVSVTVHSLAGSPDLPPLLISHATGFHAHCYRPMANALGDRYHCIGPDYRGHGETDAPLGWQVDWRAFGDDALAVAHSIAPDGGLVAFGHSMGGAALLMAARREPGVFERLVLFEPIAHPPGPERANMSEHPIVRGARRRRRRFSSFDEAYDNFVTKAPLSMMSHEALRQYVDHGFREMVEPDGTPAIELKCDPDIEADIFVRGRDNGVWTQLDEITTPCLVVGGHVEPMQPSAMSETIANELPHGRYLLLDHQTHLGPFSHPDEVAEIIAAP
jgi:pimeloyl-ACP methyl ester carboxylesterase